MSQRSGTSRRTALEAARTTTSQGLRLADRMVVWALPLSTLELVVSIWFEPPHSELSILAASPPASRSRRPTLSRAHEMPGSPADLPRERVPALSVETCETSVLTGSDGWPFPAGLRTGPVAARAGKLLITYQFVVVRIRGSTASYEHS